MARPKVATATEEPHLERLRRLIEEAYREHPTGTGGSFGEILCHEIHENGMTFIWLAQKWGVSLPTLGELIWDHCKKLEKEPLVRHGYNPDGIWRLENFSWIDLGFGKMPDEEHLP